MGAVGVKAGDRLVDGPGTSKGTGWASWASWSLPESLDPVAKGTDLGEVERVRQPDDSDCLMKNIQ